MVAIQILWFILIVVEIFRNLAIIADKKRRPVYWWSNIIRIAAGYIFWQISVLLVDMTVYQRWGLPIMMVFTAWWTFDYGLNLVRKHWPGSEFNKPFDYVNPNGSFLDRLQSKFNARFLFWMKLLLLYVGVWMYFSGVDSIWVVKW